MKFLLWFLFFTCYICNGSTILDTSIVDTSKFRVTEFASGLSFVNSVTRAADGSILAVVSPGYSTAQVVRFTDSNKDGIADGAYAVLYSSTAGGPGVQIRSGVDHYYLGELGKSAITALKKGIEGGAPLTAAGSLMFSYPPGHGHPTPGFAVRPTPGTPGSVDLVFNIGSEFNDAPSSSPVRVSGLGLTGTDLEGDSLYMITINESGTQPIAGNLRLVARGIRNVYGMAFNSANGDLYFADNAIDEGSPGATEPPQADELNRISASELGVVVRNFGYPNCYPEYRSNTLIERLTGACTGITQSLMSFQPVPAGAIPGARSEGPAEIAFAPAMFPASYQGGIFAGFSGGSDGKGGNNQNPLVFVPSNFQNHFHFIPPGLPGNLLGVYSTEDSLFVSTWGGGKIYQIQAINEVPEAGTWNMAGIVLAMELLRRTAGRLRESLTK
jgi:hypothetical protein